MTTSRQIRVVVADDFPLMRAALVESWRRDPRIDVVGQAADGAEAIALVEAERPDVLACDLEMPVLDGQQVVEHLRASPTRVLIVTGTDSPEAMMRAIDAGAAGFMTKHSSVSELCEAVLAVMRGETPIAPHLVCAFVRELTESRTELFRSGVRPSAPRGGRPPVCREGHPRQAAGPQHARPLHR